LSIKEDASMEFIRTIEARERSLYGIYLNPIGNDFMVSRSESEFKIWNLKTYECIKTYIVDSFIHLMIVTKNNHIVKPIYNY
jgi:hypothetical protein